MGVGMSDALGGLVEGAPQGIVQLHVRNRDAHERRCWRDYVARAGRRTSKPDGLGERLALVLRCHDAGFTIRRLGIGSQRRQHGSVVEGVFNA